MIATPDTLPAPQPNGTARYERDDTPNEHEARRQAILTNEPSMLDGLLAAIETRDTETKPITIERQVSGDWKPLFTFRVHGLPQGEREKAFELASRYQPNRQLGVGKVREDTSSHLYNSLLIYFATVDDDRAALWDNREMQERALGRGGELHKAKRGALLVEKALRAGEKEMVIANIDELSGFNQSLEDSAGE